MAIEFELDCACSSDVALAELKERVPEWRESFLPEAMRKKGILGVRLYSRSNAIAARYNSGVSRYRWFASNATEYELAARIVGSTTETCTVTGRCGFRPRRVGVYMPAAIGIMAVIGNQPFAASILFSVAIITFLVRQRRDQNVSRADDTARFLVERVECVVRDINQRAAC